MKNRFLANFAILTLAVSGAFSIGSLAQTTQDGAGPTEQPSAPMEGAQQGPGQVPPPPPGQAGPAGQSQSQPMEADPGGPSGEGPAKTDQGVARVSMMHGDVSTQRGDSGDWSAATLNQPVMTGDKVSTGDNARAELQLDYASIIRLGANSKTNITNLTQKNIQIQLSQGILNYSLSKDSETEPEIDTPNVSVHPAHHDGVFRIEVRPDGDTIVIVRQGEAQIATPQGSTEIHTGDMATIRGNADNAQYKVSAAPERDDWDRWNSDRDHLIRNAQSWKHTNRYYTGSQDLDGAGTWQNEPDYGDVWVPNEPDGWAPYRDGNWTYEPYYGWTWVGYEPWGWAPYHYGRWLPYGNSWAWWPGPLWGGGFYRPFWAPAYVSFYGWGGGFGFGFGWGGWGGFGWLPIGPCDWFHPWWGGYRGRFGVFNARSGNFNRFGGFSPLHAGTRFSNVANLHNPNVGRGMSVINAGHFGTGRVTPGVATREQLGSARAMAGNLPVVPSRSSLSASGRAAAPSTIRNSGSERFFGSHNNVARPQSFHEQTASLRQTMQQNHVSPVAPGGRMSAGETTAGRGSFGASRPGAGSISSRGGDRSSVPSSVSNSRPSESAGSGVGNRSAESGMQRGVTQSSGSSASRDGFRPFTPPSRSEVSRGETTRGETNGAVGPESRGNSGSYWNRTAPSSQMHTNGPVYGGSERGSSRPQLDMRQPIVRGPSSGENPGGARTAPAYGGSRPSAPSGGGRMSAPSGGGHSSAPSGGGHSSGGGGGGHSSGGGHH